MHALQRTLRSQAPHQPKSLGSTVNNLHTSAMTFRPLSQQKRECARKESESIADGDDDKYVDLPTKRRAKTSTPRPSKSQAVTLNSTQSVRGQYAPSVPPSSSQDVFLLHQPPHP